MDDVCYFICKPSKITKYANVAKILNLQSVKADFHPSRAPEISPDQAPERCPEAFTFRDKAGCARQGEPSIQPLQTPARNKQ